MQKLMLLIVLLYCTATGQAQINYLEYFFDADPGLGNGMSIPVTPGATVLEVPATINTTSLSPGPHRLYVRSRNTDGFWSLSAHQMIYKETPAPALNTALLSRAEAFFDTDPGVGMGIPLTLSSGSSPANIMQQLPTSALTPGPHRLYVRSRNADGLWSLSAHQMIYKETPAPEANIKLLTRAEAFFDTDPGLGMGIPLTLPSGNSPVNILKDLPTDTLAPGVHRLYVRSQNADGVWSLSAHQQVYKESGVLDSLAAITAMEYFIGNDPGFGKAVPLVFTLDSVINNFSFAANIAGLPAGRNYIQFRSRDALGRWSLSARDTIDLAAPTPPTAIVVNSLLLPREGSGNPGGANKEGAEGAVAQQSQNQLPSRTLCAGKPIRLAFDPKGSFASDNQFRVELSNASGSFSSPIVLGNLTGVAGASTTVSLPRHLTPGTGYRIRVSATKPVLIGDALDSLLTINDINIGPDTTYLLACLNETVNLNTLYNTTGLTSVWSTSSPTVAPAGSYNLVVNNATNCPDTALAVVILETARWLGTVSENWHTPGNWSTGKVPGNRTHVIVDGTTPFACRISASDAEAASVQVRQGSGVLTSNQRRLWIAGKCATLPSP